MDDKELYRRFVEENDTKALGELMDKYRKELIYFIQRFIKDSYLAEDVSQEVFIYLLQHKEKYNSQYSFRTFLYTIARSRALNYLKSRKKVNFIEEYQERTLSEIQNVEEEFIEKDEKAKVRQSLKKLKSDYAIGILLVDLNDMSYEEAGIIMNKSLSQMKALMHNARKRLKVILEEERKKEEENEILR